MSSTQGPQHRHRRDHKFPPQQYKDLRGSDISLLAPLFGPTPSPTSPTFAAHEENTRKKIAELPSHLRSKITLLSTFCSVHKQLNSLPISSILSFIQDEVTPQALFHWAPVERSCWLDKKTLALLEEMNAVWQSPAAFQSSYGRAPNAKSKWVFVNHKCAACKLSAIANNVPGIVAVGACVIARLDPANWKKSKRIQWFEKWIAVSVEWDHQTEGVIKAMWECGVRLRNAMGTDETPTKRAYIDEFVAQTRIPSRPARSEAQDSHVADTEKLMGGNDEDDLSDTQSVRTVRQRSPSPAPSTPKAAATDRLKSGDLPTRYVPSTDFFSRVQQSFHSNDSQTLLKPALRSPSVVSARPASSVYSQPLGKRVTSSIYSRATDDDGDNRWDSQEDWFKTSVLEEGEFIDSYSRSSRGAAGGVLPNEYGFI